VNHGTCGWARAAELFDELAPMTGPERQQRLHDETIPREVRRWLDELLAAHDSNRSLIIDRQVDTLARSLAPDAPVLAAEEYVGQRFGSWRADAEIGRGGMGVVLTGERADGQFEMRVAIKLLDPQRVSGATVEAIGRELRLLASLEHPGIARLIDGGISDDGLPFLVMEYVDGKPITEWAENNKPDVVRRVSALIDAARAVGHCHARLVVHGDIKPGNVMVDATGRVRLLDFGIASRLSDDAERATGDWCSPGYAAPERLRGAAPSVADDVYALGALLYVLLTGTAIRGAQEQTRIVTGSDRTAVNLPPAPSERLAWLGRSREARQVRGDLDVIVLHALAIDPDDRYSTVVELVDDLENALAHRPVRARSGGPGYRFRCWLRRNRALASGLGLGVFALLAGAGLAVWQADRASRSAAIAEAARGQAETALARADAINEFLVELFQSDIPRVPEGEMPTTREVVETGIERVRDPETGPPEVRASLLLTLGNVILHHLEPDRAEQLLHEADRLIGEHEIVTPRIRIDRALLRADIAMVRDQAEKVAAAADEAIELLQAHRPGSLELLEILRLRARAERRIGTLDGARERFEQVYALTEGRDDADALRLKLAQDLAVIAGMKKDFADAIEQFEEVLRLKRALEDVIPNQLATTEFNIGYALVELGEFDRARNRLQQTLDYLAEIDAPNPVRASALLAAGELHRLQGRLDPALAKYRESAREWAQVMDLESIDEDYLIHHRSALALATAGRIDAAAENMERAIERMENGDRHHPSQRIAAARAMLAELHCRAGRLPAARELLTSVDGQLDPNSSHELARARGECALAGPATDPDPALVPPAVIDEQARSPGRAIETAQLELLRARLLVRSGNPSLALDLLDSARARLDRLPLDDNHHILAAIRDTHTELAAQSH